jgi:NAD(P)-dependent dehydrogenase (short-subunit alcohol dehydrogenase family)
MLAATGSIYDKFNLSSRTALVTGGSKGIGKSIARALATAGANVVITSRNQAELDTSLRDILEGTEVKGYSLVADHSDWKNADRVADKVLEMAGHIDILVNNAGTGLVKPLEDMTNDELTYIMSLNLLNPIAMCRAFLDGMIDKKWGRIINMSSLFGVIGKELRTAYCASKGGLLSFTRAFAVELAPFGITVNALGAGPIKTSLTEGSWNDPLISMQFKKMVPLGRWGEPDEMAGAAVLLASEAGSYITGQIILIDGGASIQ